jgi:hypothetical protein
MKSNKLLISATIILGLLSLIALYFMRLALNGISHNEPDAQLEWGIIKAGFVVLAAFIITAIVTFVRIFTGRQQ